MCRMEDIGLNDQPLYQSLKQRRSKNKEKWKKKEHHPFPKYSQSH